MKHLFPFCVFPVSVCFLFAAFLCSLQNISAQDKPNIVLIIADDQHWRDYGFMGHSVVKTPHLDKLASEGLLFTRGYVPSSLCCPSLASLITGQYPHQHKITSNDPPMPADMKKAAFYKSKEYEDGRKVMIENMKKAPALPKLFAENGYISFQTGKWWLGDYTSGGFTEGMTKGGRHGDEGLKIGRETMQPIYDFLDNAEKENKPFFLWYAPMLPHSPHDPPERLLKHYTDKTSSIHQAKYWANIERFDETCGQLLSEVSKRKLDKNTVVVFVCDNGWIQEQDNPRFAPKSKQSQYDGGLRTPIIIRYLGKVQAKKDETHPVSSLDIAPTILKLAGNEKLNSQTGLDLLDEKAVVARTTLYGECFTHDFVDLFRPEKNLRFRWILEDKWKLIAGQPNEETGIELYNIIDDPNEETNLTSSEPDTVKYLLEKLDRFYKP